MRRIALPALCATVVLVAAPAMAQITAGQSARTSLVPRNSVPGNRDEDLIRSWYRDYLGREVGPELKAWTELLRGGMSALDVQATILGSDEFYNQKGRDAQTFVLETLQSITWEEPSAAELRRWTDRLRTLRGDRLELAREMLLTNGELGDTASQGSANQADIANRLTAATRLLVDTIDFEIGGTTQGRQANLKAQALADAAEQYRRATTPVGTRSLDRRQAEQAHLAVDGARRSLIALQSTLSNPPGTALSATNVARRVGDILEEADAAAHGGGSISDPVTPPRNTPPRNSPANAKLLTQVAAASGAVESIIQSLTGQANQSYSTSVVLRDLDSFAAKLDQLQTSIEDGVSRERLGWEVETLRTQAGRIGPQLLAGRPPAFTRLFWSSVESSLEQMAETLGLRAADLTDVLRPAPTTSQVLPLVDQALSRSDVFLTGTQPLVFGVPEVPRVQRDVRTIKSRLLTLRQEAQNGEPAAQQLATLNSMVADYKSAFDRWNQIVAIHRLQSPPRLSPIGEALNEVERLLKVELEFEDFAPAASVSSSRAGRLIATLSPELRLVREALPVFVNYPEHRALLTYCDQLDGYLASLTDLQRSPAAAPDAQRRQIAAMQRTAELLAATADAVAARAQGAGGRAVDAGARLAAQARRFASLVNDLESELN